MAMNSYDVVMAALLHDIGKVFARGVFLDEYRRHPAMKDIYRVGESASAQEYTRRFCRLLSQSLPMRNASLSWMDLHSEQPTDPAARLVREADRLATAEQGEIGDSIGQRDGAGRLVSMMERVNLRGRTREPRFRLPIKTLHPNGQHHFPQSLDEPDSTAISQDYAHLGAGLLDDLDKVPRPRQWDIHGARCVVRSLLSMFERSLCQVPAEVGVEHPDISLFDHLRITAAIAEGLYWHHTAHDERENIHGTQSQEKHTWRLVCGDFSGIQSFIYRITSKGAAKALRGRSLYIQLLCDAASEYLMRRLGLMPTARIYSSGGKFYLLIADVQEDELRREADKVNAWLLREFGGDVFLGIGIAKVCAENFRGGNMSAKWKEANDELMRDRKRRFAGQMDASFFAPQAALDKGAHCEVCGRSDADADLRNDRCHQCHSLEELGKSIANATHLFWRWGEDAPRFAHEPLASVSFEGLGCTLYLLKSSPAFDSEIGALNESVLERINDPECMDGNALGYACGWRWLGKWDRHKDSGHWEFHCFAEKARGVKRLGVLRMDVDNLGQLFIQGFRWADEQVMGSLSRVATLSRQLSHFFSGYLMHLLRDQEHTQIIYAGGDDLFLIGSWDALPQVARNIQQSFSRYAAHNPDFTISGGMAMVGGKYPISHAAELAGEAEERAKGLKRRVDGTDKEKSAFCMLGTPVGWEDFDAVEGLREQIEQTFAVNRSVLGRLRSTVVAQREFVRQKREAGMDEQSIQELLFWQRWRWLLVYHLHRAIDRHGELTPQVTAIRRAVLGNEIEGRNSETHVIDWLQLPVRWAEFLHREAK